MFHMSVKHIHIHIYTMSVLQTLYTCTLHSADTRQSRSHPSPPSNLYIYLYKLVLVCRHAHPSPPHHLRRFPRHQLQHKRLPLLFFYCSLEVGAHLRHCRCGLRVLQRGLRRWQQCDQETGDQDGGGRQEQPLLEEEVAEEGAIVVDKNTFYGYCGSLKRLRNAMFVLCGEFFGLIWAGVQFNHTTVTSTTW